MVGWIIGAQGENVQSSDTFLKHDWIGNFKKRTARNSGLLVQFSNTKAWKLDHKDETWYTVFTYLEVVLDYLEVSLYCKFHYWGLLKYQICFNTVPHLKESYLTEFMQKIILIFHSWIGLKYKWIETTYKQHYRCTLLAWIQPNSWIKTLILRIQAKNKFLCLF